MKTARRRPSTGSLTLAEAVANLMQTQAIFLESMAKMKIEILAIHEELNEIKAILLRHERILNELPEALKQKIGFKSR